MKYCVTKMALLGSLHPKIQDTSTYLLFEPARKIGFQAGGNKTSEVGVNFTNDI